MRHSRWLHFLFGAALALPAAGPVLAQQAAKAAADEFAARGQREARAFKYGDWQKFCFTPGSAKMVCRTTISGSFESGQTAVRVYVTERECDNAARRRRGRPGGRGGRPGGGRAGGGGT